VKLSGVLVLERKDGFYDLHIPTHYEMQWNEGYHFKQRKLQQARSVSLCKNGAASGPATGYAVPISALVKPRIGVCFTLQQRLRKDPYYP
jgi:hypothetical protein